MSAAPSRAAAPTAAMPTSAVHERTATRPVEARGGQRDEVRLLVARSGGIEHARFHDLASFLSPGDLLVVNTSATMPAAVDAARGSGEGIAVHFSTELDGGNWIVELRAADGSAPVLDGVPGEQLALDGGAGLELVAPRYWSAHRGGVRLWTARPRVGMGVREFLEAHGRPIAYGYLDGAWPIAYYQTIFGQHPGSAEMASAARPFTWRVLADVAARGVAVRPIVLHTGVSSLERGEPPQPERFCVGRETAEAVNATRQAGGRVVAVGTTVTRALESAVGEDGAARASRGWTDLVLGPDRPARVVDGLVTGWHETDASHMALLRAVVDGTVVERAYAEARESGYLWHEFGDSCLLLPP